MTQEKKGRLAPLAMVSVAMILAAVGLVLVVTMNAPSGPGTAASAVDHPFQRPYPMPHKWWHKNEEFYVFGGGGQQGGIYVYGIPSMKLIAEIPVFNADPRWGWTPATREVREMMTNPATGELVYFGDTHHPVLSKTGAKYDGRFLFINDKMHARVARIDLSTFRTKQMLWVPNVKGGLHGFHCDADTRLIVGNIELEQYPSREILDYLDVPVDRLNGPYVSCIFGVDVAPDGTMKMAWQVWGPWQYDLLRIGWGESQGWFVNTAYNTERSVNTVGMFKRPEDYLFLWNVESIRRAIAERKYITTKEAPDVPVLRWKDVETYAVPCPLNPHGVDVDPSGRYAVVAGKATTVVRWFDLPRIREAIQAKRFAGEEFGVKVVDPKGVTGDVDAGLGPTHIEFDNEGHLYAGFFVDSDVKKITMGEPWTQKHGKPAWTVVDTIPAHYSVGHLLVPGGDTAEPYGKYLVIMNKLAKDTFAPHGPLVTECHELYHIEKTPAPLIDQMPLPPEVHYAQAIPVKLLAPKIKQVYELPKDIAPPGVTYDYAKREVHVNMTAVRSFFTPDFFTVPQNWLVRFHVTNVEQAFDITHGFALMGYDVMESLDPGEVKVMEVRANRDGVYWYYCLWFCSELHMEMRGRMIVIPEAEWKPELEWKAKK